jgi:predicted DNA-binding transcriptional regulator AlpA
MPKTTMTKATRPRLIDRTEVMYRIPLSWPTLERRIKEGLFPPYRNISNKLMWIESEVDAFIAGTWTAPRRDKVEA